MPPMDKDGRSMEPGRNRAGSVRALVLAAGRGTRLNQLTHDRPKSLVALEGKTLLEWQIASLRAAGVSEIAVVRGYRGEMIDLPGLAYLENVDWARTNMVHSLRCADEWLNASICIVSYGDIVYHPSLVSTLVDTPGEVVVAYDVLWERLWQERFEDPAVDAESFRIEDGWIVEIGGRVSSLESVDGQYLGLFKLAPEGWRKIRGFLSLTEDAVARSLDVTALLSRLIGEGIKVKGTPIRGRWCELDHVTDLRLYERMIQSDTQWSHDWRV